MDIMREQLVVPHIKRLKERAKQQCSSELDKFFSEHPDLTPEIKEACEEYSRQMAAKWLHEQITTLKEQGTILSNNLEGISLNLDLNPVKVTKYLKHSPMYYAAQQQRRGMA
jgi:glutamyl-tRNA reductase